MDWGGGGGGGVEYGIFDLYSLLFEMIAGMLDGYGCCAGLYMFGVY